MTDVTFRYDRAPTGELSGESLVEQTEQALSELGQEASQAKTDAQEAIHIATIASESADHAVSIATNAQESAGSAIAVAQTAQTSAAQAVQTAQDAVQRAQTASQSAQTAAKSAQTAQTAAENAASNAQTAAGAASQSAQDAQTAQGAASAAQTAAENAQTSASQAATIATQAQSAAAQSAQAASAAQTAAETLASPNRYSAKTTSLTLSAGQTISITDLDNVNVAVGNKIIDAVGNIFSIASIDTANNQVTLASGDPSATPPDLGYWENPAVRVSGDQTVGGVKTFSSSPIVPTPTSGDDSTKVATTAYVQAEIASKANDSEVVKLTGNQTIAGTKTFSSTPKIKTASAGNNSTYSASTAFVQTAIATQAVKFDSAQTLTDAEKTQARSNIGAPSSSEMQSAVNGVAPVGSYIYFAGSSVPTHYLLCNGAAVSRTTYAALFAVIGVTYGAGNGSTTFNLPNLIDKFLEGSGTSGTEKSAGLPNITGAVGSIFSRLNDAASVNALYWENSYSAVSMANGGGPSKGDITLNASRSSAIYGSSDTVQPPALTALVCIRYE